MLTVGKLRALIADLSDDALVAPDWHPDFEPGDDDPRVSIDGASVSHTRIALRPNTDPPAKFTSAPPVAYLSIHVSLSPLNSDEEDEDDE